VTNPLPKEILAIRACAETGSEFVRVFTCSHAGPVTPNSVEIFEGRWIEPAEIERWVEARPDDFSPSFRLAWRLFPAA